MKIDFFLLVVGWFVGALSSKALADTSHRREQMNVTITSDTWCPYNCSAESPVQGFTVDVIREILEPLGYRVVYLNESWTDAVSHVREGRYDAIIGASASEATGLALVPEPLAENQTCFYTLKDDPFRFKHGESLSSRRIGLTYGYLYGEFIDQYAKKYRHDGSFVQFVTGDKPLLKNIRKLKARRVDTIVENQVVMNYSVKKFGLDGIRLAGCETPSSLYMAFSTRRPDLKPLVEATSEGLKRLKASGLYHKLAAKYNVDL